MKNRLLGYKMSQIIKSNERTSSSSVCKKNTANLTTIKWAHAVNSVPELKTALKSNVHMIEADVLMGQLFEQPKVIPIMAHPPIYMSDLSLRDFLHNVEAHNATCQTKDVKGIKLDFKCIEALEIALKTEKDQLLKANYPIWLNADIIDGPCDSIHQKPLNANQFLSKCREFSHAVLSVGWTTDANATFNCSSYRANDIETMISSIKNNNITNKHCITFPVRAGIAANSIEQLYDLICRVNETHRATLTIWSAPGDHVNIDKLEKLISFIGFDRVYLDLPAELFNQLKIITPS